MSGIFLVLVTLISSAIWCVANENVSIYLPLAMKDDETGYTVSVLFGSPPQKLSLILDTGSSNTAVAGEGCCKGTVVTPFFNETASKTSKNTTEVHVVTVVYTHSSRSNASWTGIAFNDRVIIGDNTTIDKAHFVVISEQSNIFVDPTSQNGQGVLGLAYPSIAGGNIPPLLDTLVATGVKDRFAIELCEGTGSLWIGNFNVEDRFDISTSVRFSVLEKSYYVINMTYIAVGNRPLDIKPIEFNIGRSTVDTGTAVMSMPNSVFIVFVEAMKNAVPSMSDGFWSGAECLPISDFLNWPAITFSIANSHGQVVRFAISHWMYLTFNVADNEWCFNVQSLSSRGVILGKNVLEGYVTIFDRANMEISMAISNTCGGHVPRIPNVSPHPSPTSTSLPLNPSDTPILKWAGIGAGITLLLIVSGCLYVHFRPKRKPQESPHHQGNVSESSSLLSPPPYGGGVV